MINKNLSNLLICSTITLTGTIGLWLGISLSTLEEASLAQETELNPSLLEAVKLEQQMVDLYDQGKYAEAISLAEKILAIHQKEYGNEHPETAISLNNLAELYRRQEIKLSEAESLYKQALAIRQKNENHSETAISLNNLGLLYRSQGKLSEAESLYKQALTIVREKLRNNHPNTGIFMNNLAELYRVQGIKLSEAEALYKQALTINRQLRDNLNTATSINGLGVLYRIQGRYTEAEPLYKEALAIRQKQLPNNPSDIAYSLNNLGVLYRLQGSLSEAEPLFQQALAIRKKSGNALNIAVSLNNLAELYYDQGRLLEAEPLFQQALAIFQQSPKNHPNTAISLSNLAFINQSQALLALSQKEYIEAKKKFFKAEDRFQQALAIRQELGNALDIAFSLNNLAGLYLIQGKLDKAEPLFQQALAIFREQSKQDNNLYIANSLNNLAATYESQGKLDEAESLYKQALAIFQQQLGNNHPNVAVSFNNLAALSESQGNINRAIELQTSGIEIQEYNLSENLIAGSEEQKRNYIATIFGSTNGAISLNLKSASDNTDATNLALTTILQRKGRILDVLTNSLQILRQQTDDPTTQNLLTEYSNLRNQYSNLVFRKPEDIKSPDIHRQQLIELETQTKQLEDKLSRRSAGFRELSEPITLEKIQQLIPPNSALIELVRYQPFNPQETIDKRWGEPRYAAYILHSQGNPQAIDLGEAESIDKAVDKFRKTLCTTTEPTESSIENCIRNLPIPRVKASARELEQMVMQPVRELLGETKNILLSPDSKLNLVPFEALVDEQDRYLVENYNFTYLTSGRDLMRLQHKSPSESMPLIIADPLYSEDTNLVASNRSLENISQLFDKLSFARLPETETEAKAIQSQLNLPEKQIKLQNEATESLLKQVKSPEILHIATHGFFLDKPITETALKQESSLQSNLDKPITIDNALFRSGLVLAKEKVDVDKRKELEESETANDGVLTAYETTFLDLTGTKLVVLSACDTGVGDISTGEGIYGLRRALVIAGTISFWLGFSLFPLKQVSIAQEETSSKNSALIEADNLTQQVIQLYKQGKYQEAIPLAEKVLAIRKQYLGENNLSIAYGLNNLAELYKAQGEYTKAETLYQQALTIKQKLLGDNHLDTAVSYNNLAELYAVIGQYTEAQSLHEKALSIRKQQLGNNHLDTAISYNNLAAIYDDLGQYSKAESLYEQALVIKQKLLGNNHISTAISLNNLGFVYEVPGKHQDAESSYQTALNIAREQLGKNHPDTATFYANLARISNAQGNYKSAENYHNAAFKIRKEQLGEKHPLTAESINDLGSSYQAQERYQEAESFYIKALTIMQDNLQQNSSKNDYQAVSNSLNNLATLYHVLGKYEQAETFYLDTLAITKQLGTNRKDTAQTLNNLAELYLFLGQYIKAEPLYMEALEIKIKKEDLRDTALTLQSLAALYRLQGRLEDAESFHIKALAIKENQKGDFFEPKTELDSIKALYKLRVKHEGIESFYLKILEKNIEKFGNKHPETLSTLNNLAVFYETQGWYEDAENIYKKIVEIKRKIWQQDNLSTAININNLAGIYRIKEKYTEAQPLYQQVLEIRKRISGNNHPDTATSLNNLAANYKAQGKYREAEKLYQQALKIREEQLGKNHPDTAASFYNLATLYQSQRDTEQAVKNLTQGLAVEEKNLSENLIAGSEKQKRDYIATISGTTNATISLNLQNISHKSKLTKLALTTILQRKGRILDVLTNSLQILRQRTNDSETQQLLTDYYNFRNEYSKLVFDQSQETESPNNHDDKLSDLDRETKQLEDKLSRRSAEFRNFSEDITLEKIQKLIPQDSALVELVRYQTFNAQAPVRKKWGEFRYAAYILHSKEEPQVIDLGEAEPIDKAVDEFRRNLCANSKGNKDADFCIQGNFAKLKASSRQLEQLVMQPVRELLGETKNILLSPDSKLNLVPFEALVDENKQYLVENYNFTYLTSGRDLIRLQHKSPSKELPLIVADPSYNEKASVSAANNEQSLAKIGNNSEDNLIGGSLSIRSLEKISQLFKPDAFPRLEATEKEAQEISSILNLSTERVKLQNQANETLLKQVQSPHILHIATHGFFLDKSIETQFNVASNRMNDNPLLRSGLALAGVTVTSRFGEVQPENDGIFTAYEATFLDLVGTKLVVLSACDTGVGDISTGEGIYGLRRALVIAGSESQLISLWKVSDEGTKDLMVAYYEQLKQGAGRTNALHEIQRKMLRGKLRGDNEKSYEHPYYWASFIPSGDWTPMEFSLSR